MAMSFYIFLFLGRDDLNEIADDDGVAYDEGEATAESEDESHIFDAAAVTSKFIRVVTHEEEFKYILAVEVGIADRNISLQIVNDRTELELSYRVPAPPDGMFQAAGMHAALASAEPTSEVFYYKPSMQLSGKHEVIYYPSQDNAEWVIFKYDLEEPRPDTPVVMNISKKAKK
jgi:hypothetical protein